ncbi:hypothetical protein Rhopal_006020-T1 [Rhodotorula paludigena]|uniref:Histidine kinase n=1 Tax=Rhodotorula paludigena TaxID=86838 RepID=A0AAV5GK28_9BASI|nr:hypothetical protein Rhopal_006020-T1 [Rhodotorula paludigena]
MTRPAPPFLRTNSSPSSVSSAHITFPASRTDTGFDAVASSLLHALPLPHLVFDSFLRLHSLNDAARSTFGITSGHGGPSAAGADFPPGGADVFFCVTQEMQARAAAQAEASLPAEAKIRLELERLADRQEDRERGHGGAAIDWSWGEGDKVELKSGKVPGMRWAAEVKVTRFYPPSANPTARRSSSAEREKEQMHDWLNKGRHGSTQPSFTPSASSAWYSVLLLRPWRDPQPSSASNDRFLSHRRSFSLDTPIATASTSPFAQNYTPTAPDFPPVPPPTGATAPAVSSSPPAPPPVRRKDSYAASERTPTLGSALTAANPFGWSSIAQRRGSASLLSSASTTPQVGSSRNGDGSSWEFAQPFGATAEEAEEPGQRRDEASDEAGGVRRSSLTGASTNAAEWPGVNAPVAPGLSQRRDSSSLRLPHAALAAAKAITPKTALGRQLGGSAGSDSSGSGGSAGSLGSAGSPHSLASTAATSPSRRGSTVSPVIPETLKGMGISVSSAGIQLSQSSPLVVPPPEATPPATVSAAPLPAKDPRSPDLSTPGGGITPTQQNPTSQPFILPLPKPRQPHPLSFTRSASSSSSPASSASSQTGAPLYNPAPLASPRPTALPPLPVKVSPTQPETPALLKFAAIANLPKTGVIISDAEFTSGYVNALARELLMGVPSTDGMPSPSKEHSHLRADWWTLGEWSVEEEPWSSVSAGTQMSNSSQPFFSPSADLRANPFDAKDLTLSSIIASGEASFVEAGKGTAGTNLRIGRASESNRYRTTVAGILARSLVSDERKKAALGKNTLSPSGTSPGPAHDYTTPAGLRGFSTHGALRSPGGGSTASSSGSGSSSAQQTPQFVAAGGVGAQGRKPYKVFDASFSQRIIDPFEPLLEMCARRGDEPPAADPDNSDDDDDVAAGQITNGMVIGVEVEVWDAPTGPSSNPLKQDSFTATDPSQNFGQRKKRVRRRVVELTASPIYAPRADGSRQHLGGVLLIRDVTDERKRRASHTQLTSKRKAAAGDKSFKQILDNLPQMVWRTTPLGSHNYFNQTWYDYTGGEPETSLGLGWQSPFHEDDMPTCLKAWSHSLATGEPYAVEYRCRRHDGAWRWMLGRARPYRDADGKIQGWFGTCTDFDELYYMREQLRSTLQQNSAVVRGAGCLLIAIDSNLRVTFYEGAEKELILNAFNIQGPIEGQDFSVLQPPDEFRARVMKVISGESPQEQDEWQSQRARRYRCLLTPLTETRNGTTSIVGCIIVAHDITDLVKTQERLQQVYEERAKLQASETAATEASRLKSEFLALTSHELRTPIAHMLGLSELLLAEELTETQKSLASQILRSGDVLLEMIGQVLDMGKVEAGKLDLESRAFDLNELSSDARLFATAAKKKGLRFVEDVDEFHQQVMGDMPRLRQVLTNLLSNAVKFTKSGSITLRVKKLAEDGRSVRVCWTVQDTGVGIRKEAISQLFKPFHQADVSTSRQFGGTGLGLSISKNLIELMGGTITLESEYGVGTTMRAELTLEKAFDQVLELVDSKAPKVDEGLRKEDTWLLVVDDNELNRLIITKLLTKMSFNVDSVGNGYDALAAVEKKRYDLVILDHQMDGIDGLETMIRMRQSNNPQVANVKVVALTASALKGDQEKFLANGADGYLSKPVRSNVLEATILRTLAPTGPTIARRTSLTATPRNGGEPTFVGTPPAESSSETGFNFGGFKLDGPARQPDDVAPPRRRPSHPSYGEGST